MYLWINSLLLSEIYISILEISISVAVALSLVVSVDKILYVLKYVQIRICTRIRGRAPAEKFRFQTLPDPVHFSHLYPMVAVQLPMFNERNVCQDIIDCACSLQWPKNRFKVQVRAESP